MTGTTPEQDLPWPHVQAKINGAVNQIKCELKPCCMMCTVQALGSPDHIIHFIYWAGVISRDCTEILKKLKANVNMSESEKTSCDWMKQQQQVNTWNSIVHDVWLVTSDDQIHCPKLYVQARHHSWNDRFVVTWKLSGENQMPRMLSMRIQSSETVCEKEDRATWKPLNGDRRFCQPSWLSATSKISLWLQSKAICHVKCAIFRRLHFGPVWQGQFCALKCSMQLDEVDHGIWVFAFCESSIVRRRYAQFKRRFMWERERTMKASPIDWFPFLFVCKDLYRSARVSWML